MTEPVIAGKAPIRVELEAGKDYAWCTCGRSQNQPFCDGSHKVTDFKPLHFQIENAEEKHLCACKRTGNRPFCDGTHKTL